MRITFIKDFLKPSGKYITEGREVECTREKSEEYINGGYALYTDEMPILPAHKRRSRKKKKNEIKSTNPDTGEKITTSEY